MAESASINRRASERYLVFNRFVFSKIIICGLNIDKLHIYHPHFGFSITF